MSTVLILGDSTSTTIGLERRSYPFLVAAEPVYEPQSVFWNASIAGFTAADASRCLLEFGKAVGRPDAVILHLGNCDAMASEWPKGRYRGWRTAIPLPAALRRRRPPPLVNRLRHMAYARDLDLSRERPESVDDFAANIRDILDSARAGDVPVVLVNPLAHRDFPAGLGRGNFLFYRIVDYRERIADQIADAPQILVAALQAEETGALDDAMQLYAILEKSVTASNPELGRIARHNAALLLDRMGRPLEALERLDAQLGEADCRSEIVHYNRARLLRRMGRGEEAEAALDRAFESDIFMYRVRSVYRDAIAAEARRRADDRLFGYVDVADVAGDVDFVDHCHLLPEAQRRLADRVLERLRACLPPGAHPGAIRNHVFNPEYAFGDDRGLIDYFNASGIRGTLDSHVHAAAAALEIHLPDHLPDHVMDSVRRTLERAAQHPLFPTSADLRLRPPRFAWEVGRMPEVYLFRLILPYVAYGDEHGLFDGLRPILDLPEAEDYRRALTPYGDGEAVVAPAPAEFIGLGDGAERFDRILAAVESRILDGLAVAPDPHRRVKTTIFWYLRESFRFGGHSRLSMLYDGVSFAEAAEALAGCLVIDHALALGRSAAVHALARWVASVRDVHDRFCAAGVLDAGPEALAAYTEALERLRTECRESSGG